MRVVILSRLAFNDLMERNNITDDNVEGHDQAMFISIHDTESIPGFRPKHFQHNHNNVMLLDFDDCEHDGEASPTNNIPTTVAFKETMANELYRFIKQNRDKQTCVVHCMAGISRSGAVGTFINGYCGGDWDLFKRENPQIIPNARVLRLLNEAKRKDKEN